MAGAVGVKGEAPPSRDLLVQEDLIKVPWGLGEWVPVLIVSPDEDVITHEQGLGAKRCGLAIIVFYDPKLDRYSPFCFYIHQAPPTLLTE